MHSLEPDVATSHGGSAEQLHHVHSVNDRRNKKNGGEIDEVAETGIIQLHLSVAVVEREE